MVKPEHKQALWEWVNVVCSHEDQLWCKGNTGSRDHENPFGWESQEGEGRLREGVSRSKTARTHVDTCGHMWTRVKHRHTLKSTLTGRENNSPLSIALYCVKVPPSQFCLLANNRNMPKSCCVVIFTTNRVNNPRLKFLKAADPKKQYFYEDKSGNRCEESAERM